MVDVVRHPLIDEILDARRHFGRGRDAAFEGYRNHAHRIFTEEASRYLRDTGREAWHREVAPMIAFHHRVRPYRGESAALVEPFRRADWNDFFAALAIRWVLRHPLRPAPPFRGGAALRRTGRG